VYTKDFKKIKIYSKPFMGEIFGSTGKTKFFNHVFVRNKKQRIMPQNP